MSGLTKLSIASKLYVSLAAVYAIMAIVLPINPASRAQYGLSEMNYVLLLFAIRIPVVIVLCTMFFAYRQLHHYAKSVADTDDGKHFASIAHGVGWIIWGLLLAGMSVSVLTAIANVQPDFRTVAQIISNYAYVILTIGAFIYISNGAHRLARQSKQIFTTRQMRWLFFGLTFLGVGFCYLMSIRLSGDGPLDSFNSFYMPTLLVWATIVIPYLFAWFLGFFAALELLLTAQNSPGIIYRRALQYLAAGVVILIFALIVLQYYRGIVPRTGGLTVGATLLFTYATYLLNVIGSLLLIKGARRLKRIEEI